VRIVRRLIPVEHGRDAGVVDPQQPNPFGMAPREVSGFREGRDPSLAGALSASLDRTAERLLFSCLMFEF
jgi:hypothetical protein